MRKREAIQPRNIERAKADAGLKSRMRENRTSGSVRGCKTEPLTQTKLGFKRGGKSRKSTRLIEMQVSTNNLVSITEANQNFSRVARMVDENGAAIILKNNAPRYILMEYREVQNEVLAEDENVETVGRRFIEKYRLAFKELAK